MTAPNSDFFELLPPVRSVTRTRRGVDLDTGIERVRLEFIDNGYRLHYDLSDPEHVEIWSEGGQLTEYVFAGPSIAAILERYTQLTGRMNAPPLWALGHHQCRWYDYSEREWLALGGMYREKQIPCDTLWLDIGYMRGYRVFTWDRDRHPHAERSLEQLREDGFPEFARVTGTRD